MSRGVQVLLYVLDAGITVGAIGSAMALAIYLLKSYRGLYIVPAADRLVQKYTGFANGLLWSALACRLLLAVLG